MRTKVLEQHPHPKHARLIIDRRTNSRFYQARTFLDGRLVQKSTKTTNLPTALKLAEDWYKRLVRSSVTFGKQHPIRKLTTNPTMSELFSSYRSTLTGAKKAYADMKWGPIALFWRAILVQDINLQSFRDFYSWRRKRDKVKNNTLHKDVMLVRQCLNHAIDEEFIEQLPRIPPVGKIEANPRPWLTPAEYKHLRLVSERRIKEAGNIRTRQQRQDLHDFIIFMVHSMCRVGEVKDLRFADCRLETNKGGDKMLLCEVTGKRGTRTIVALTGAAAVYERRLRNAKLTDKIWNAHHKDAFAELLEDAGLRRDAHGFMRTLKSLRATSISFRILNNPELNLTLIARNAGTSIVQIDQFYAKRLTAEMHKEVLSEMPRRRTQKPSRTPKNATATEPNTSSQPQNEMDHDEQVRGTSDISKAPLKKSHAPSRRKGSVLGVSPRESLFDDADPIADWEKAFPDYEALLGKYQERIRQRAEKAIQRLIHAEYQRRLRAANVFLRSKKFRNIGARQKAAEKRTGLAREEVYGGVLDLTDALSINDESDVTRGLAAMNDETQQGRRDGGNTSILVCAETVGIIGGLKGAGAVVRCIAAARKSVPQSKRLQQAERAREVAEAHETAETRAETEASYVKLRDMGSHRRRRRLKVLQPVENV